MSANIKIRDLTSADWTSWQRLAMIYVRDHEMGHPADAIGPTFDRLTDLEIPSVRGLLIFVDGVARGFLHFMTHSYCWRKEDVTYVQDLFVEEAARGQGLARKLMARVYQEADQAGTSQVYWLALTGNKPARGLYDQIGQVQDLVQYRRLNLTEAWHR